MMNNEYYRKYLFTLWIPQAINAVTVILWITVLIRRAINAVTVIRPETGQNPAGFLLKAFLEASGAADFCFWEKHVPGILNMPKCQKVSKSFKMSENSSKWCQSALKYTKFR